jgi:hypothetical protein
VEVIGSRSLRSIRCARRLIAQIIGSACDAVSLIRDSPMYRQADGRRGVKQTDRRAEGPTGRRPIGRQGVGRTRTALGVPENLLNIIGAVAGECEGSDDDDDGAARRSVNAVMV